MPGESLQSKVHRTSRIVDRLKETYPDAHCELVHSSPFELLIATILSAQCTDKQVNVVTADLFKKYRTPNDYAEADLSELEADLRRIGLFRSKARNIQSCCRELVSSFHSQVPQTLEALTSLAGVGRKTANVVLGNAFGISSGVVVDTHVARLSRRLGLTRDEKPEKIEAELQRLIPQESWTMFSHWIIWHGRRRCFARNPQCYDCEIKELCPSASQKT
jgi:endonuclease III